MFESEAIRWHGDRLELLDQRRLPAEENWLNLVDADGVAAAIREMAVRGAPAIGIAAAYGVALEARRLGESVSDSALDAAFQALAASRPTAVNLFWALERMRMVAATGGNDLAGRLAAEALDIHREDQTMNRRLAEHGAALLPDDARVYTHCNTGALATGGHGTALGILRTAFAQGKLHRVYAGETRPWLQGSRLTTWELLRAGVPVQLVIDSCAASLMRSGRVNAVVVGADRITANGDVANKIGTYSLAVLARYHRLPFIVAAPRSTLDADTESGDDIVIEERPPEEITAIQGVPVAPAGCPAFNPAFDITPAELVTAVVTEAGVIRSPGPGDIRRHLEANHE